MRTIWKSISCFRADGKPRICLKAGQRAFESRSEEQKHEQRGQVFSSSARFLSRRQSLAGRQEVGEWYANDGLKFSSALTESAAQRRVVSIGKESEADKKGIGSQPFCD